MTLLGDIPVTKPNWRLLPRTSAGPAGGPEAGPGSRARESPRPTQRPRRPCRGAHPNYVLATGTDRRRVPAGSVAAPGSGTTAALQALQPTQEHEPRPRSPLPRDFGRTRLLTSGTLRPFRSFDRGSPLPGHKHGWAARQAHARPPGGPGVPLAGAGPPPGRWPGPSALTADRARASPAAGRAAEAGAEAEVAGSGTATPTPPPLPRSLAAENASQRAAPRPPGAAQKFRGRRRAGGRGRRPSRGRGRPAAGPRRRGLTSFWRGSCG